MATGFLISGSPASSADSSSSIVKSYNNAIAPNSSQIVDSIAFVNFMSAKWLITIVDIVNNTMQTYELNGQGSTTIAPTMVRYGLTGALIDNMPGLSYNSLTQTIDLAIQNNTNNQLTAHLARYNLSN